MSVPSKILFTALCAAALSACNSSDEGELDTNAQARDTVSFLTTILAGGNSPSLSIDSAALLESDEALRIAQSYPVPELPANDTPFQVQTNTRFEQWTLSSMIRHSKTDDSNSKDSDTDEWVWTKQEFFRVALTDAEAEPSRSKWGFTDIVGQRFTQYHFGRQERKTDITAERLALNLASVSSHSIVLNDIGFKVDNTGCKSTLTVKRNVEDITWQSSECPNWLRVNDTVVGNTTRVLPAGISWVSQAYGQLPTGSGAVAIDRLDVLMPDGGQLNVSRSRRKSGAGPITVAATLKGETLGEVTWSDAPLDGAVFPQEIVLNIPSLSQSFVVSIPDAINRETSLVNTSAQHGVTVTGGDDNEWVLPGVLTMSPINVQGL